MADLPKLEGHITVPTGGWTVSITEVPAATSTYTIPAGNYYLTSTTSLLTTLSAGLTANATLAGTYSCVISDDASTSTGKVTLSATGITTFSVTWTSTALRDALGWTGNTSGALTFTSQSASPYIFLPNVKRANPMAPDGYQGLPVTDGTVTVSPSGTSKSIKYATRYIDSLEFRFLLGSKTWTTWEVVTNESLESFYASTIGEGAPFRYHFDRANDSSHASYRSLAIGSMSVVPAIPGFVGSANSLWNYGPTGLIKYVES